MKELYVERIANHHTPSSCSGPCKGTGEAIVRGTRRQAY